MKEENVTDESFIKNSLLAMKISQKFEFIYKRNHV